VPSPLGRTSWLTIHPRIMWHVPVCFRHYVIKPF
jgi:hypothetical protein